MEFKNYYNILQVAQDATQDEIKKAYRRLAKIWHPDINKSSSATETMQLITEAYVVLSDVVKRRDYDKKFANEFKESFSVTHNSNEKAYSSYTKSREESESDFEEWLKEYLKINIDKLNIIKLKNLEYNIIKEYNDKFCLDKNNIVFEDDLQKKKILIKKL